jgi:hypothetical protein
MKHLSSTSWLLSAMVLLCGCGGGYQATGKAGFPDPKPPDPNPHGMNIVSNWQFSTTSAISGIPSMTIAGSISQSGSAVSGAVHVDGSNCFDRLTVVGLSGTLTGGNISLTTTSVAGQVTTFTGSFSGGTLTGTYAINGGCADGDHGNVFGSEIPYIANILNGTFTTSGGATFSVAGDVAQNANADPEGSFGVSGKVTFNTSCFTSGTITPGTFPSGSFIIGTTVALAIQTANGTFAFLGTLDRDKGEIGGDYTVFGGTCDQTGTAVLVTSSPWDY